MSELPIGLWCTQIDARLWLKNWEEMHASQAGDTPPFPYRLLVGATLDPQWESSTVEKTIEALREFSAAGHDVMPGVIHPSIREYDDWFKLETWQEVADAFTRMFGWVFHNTLFYDIEPYLLRTPPRYPLRSEITEDVGWRLADAMRPLIYQLRSTGTTLMIEQAHENHLMEWVLRISGVSVIWADSKQKGMAYDASKEWNAIGHDARDMAHQAGAKRHATIIARDLATGSAVTSAIVTSDGRINVFWKNWQDTDADPSLSYLKNFPKAGWANPLME